MLPIKRDIVMHYMDLLGVVTIDRDAHKPFQKNGLMQLGFYVACLDAIKDLDKHDRESFYDTVSQCQVEDGKPGVYFKGIYNRLPGCSDESSHDDTRGVIGGSIILGLDFHKDVLKWGLKHFFNYNNVNPNKFSFWSWRLYRLDEVAFYFLANKLLRALATPVLMGIIQLRLMFTGLNYYRLLDFTAIQSLSKSSFLWSCYKNFWLKRARLSDATESYFKTGHPMINLALMVEYLNINEKVK